MDPLFPSPLMRPGDGSGGMFQPGWPCLSRKENTQGVLYSGPGLRVLYAFFTRFFDAFLL